MSEIQPQSISDTAENNLNSKGQTLNSLLINNDSIAYKKTSKIFAAILLVTNSIDCSDVIKDRLQTLAMELLQYGSKITFSREHTELNISIVDRTIGELSTIIATLELTGLLSVGNAMLLIKELQTLAKLIHVIPQESVPLVRNSEPKLDQTFFSVSGNTYGEEKAVPAGSSTYANKGHQKDMSFIKRDTSKIQNTKTISDAAIRHSRRSTIISVIKQKGTATVNDITMVIKDCSTKTIQRELNDMIQENVLSKIGEKRWSRYSLKTSS